MQVNAKTRFLRISPQKLRLVADLVRSKNAVEAVERLKFLPKKGARLIRKTIQSAIANAENNYNLNAEDLVIKEIQVNRGPIMRRVKPRARGRADVIQKRSSHLLVTLEGV